MEKGAWSAKRSAGLVAWLGALHLRGQLASEACPNRPALAWLCWRPTRCCTVCAKLNIATADGSERPCKPANADAAAGRHERRPWRLPIRPCAWTGKCRAGAWRAVVQARAPSRRAPPPLRPSSLFSALYPLPPPHPVRGAAHPTARCVWSLSAAAFLLPCKDDRRSPVEPCYNKIAMPSPLPRAPAIIAGNVDRT